MRFLSQARRQGAAFHGGPIDPQAGPGAVASPEPPCSVRSLPWARYRASCHLDVEAHVRDFPDLAYGVQPTWCRP